MIMYKNIKHKKIKYKEIKYKKIKYKKIKYKKIKYEKIKYKKIKYKNIKFKIKYKKIKYRRLTNAFTEKSRNPSYVRLSLGYSISEAWNHPRIHCRYSNRTDQCLTHLDILLVKAWTHQRIHIEIQEPFLCPSLITIF